MARAPIVDDVVRRAARDFDPDRYLAALLAPAAVRPDLITLAAFAGEVSRIPRLAHEPRIAAIRLEWWYEALTGGGGSGNPVADAAANLIGNRQLDPAPWLATIDAWDALLEPATDPGERAAWEVLGATERGSFRAGAAILGLAFDDGIERTIALAAEAFAMTRRLGGEAAGAAPTLWRLPPAPASHWLEGIRRRLGEVRSRLIGAPRGLHDALRPLALVEPYLQALESRRVADGAVPPEITPLARAWNLWRSKWTGRI